jgi:hypothetical protein
MPRNKKNISGNRKSARKTRAESKRRPSKNTTPTKAVKTTPEPQPQQKSAGSNRAEGIRLFKLAGRPTKAEFVVVYGERGPKMTWDQRAAAGIPANKFQAVLAAKQNG